MNDLIQTQADVVMRMNKTISLMRDVVIPALPFKGVWEQIEGIDDRRCKDLDMIGGVDWILRNSSGEHTFATRTQSGTNYQTITFGRRKGSVTRFSDADFTLHAYLSKRRVEAIYVVETWRLRELLSNATETLVGSRFGGGSFLSLPVDHPWLREHVKVIVDRRPNDEPT